MLSLHRTLHDWSNWRRIKINENWRFGRYFEHTFFRHKIMYPSYIHLEKDLFYMTHGGELRIYQRCPENIINTIPLQCIGHRKIADITCFTKNGNTIFGGRENGNIFIYDADDILEENASSNHDSVAINAVDCSNQRTFVTASKKEVKLWQRQYELTMIMLVPKWDYLEYYKSVRISPDGVWLAAGKYRDKEHNALDLFDIETYVILMNIYSTFLLKSFNNFSCTRSTINSRSTSIYAMLWKDNNTIMTGNYDSTLRIIDTRCNEEVQRWTDAYDSAIFTLDYDGLNGVVCGQNYHCRVTLYDLRTPGKFIQMYYPKMKYSERGSPVYGIACDAGNFGNLIEIVPFLILLSIYLFFSAFIHWY